MTILFLNVRAEMVKAGINVSTLAKEMGITAQALYKKFNGTSEFSLKDTIAIRDILSKYTNEKLDIEYLFGAKYDS